MYPTIVIVLVNSQRSMVDTYGFTNVLNKKQGETLDVEARPATVGHLSFVVSDDTSTYVASDINSQTHESVNA